MNATELRTKKPAELKQKLIDLLKNQFDLRMAKGNGQLTKINVLKEVRRDIARVKTIIKQQESLSKKDKVGTK
jgi:large subunit ribosomal protein L29